MLKVIDGSVGYYAKKETIWDTVHNMDPDAPTRRFPWKPYPLSISRKGKKLCFWVQKRLACTQFHDANNLHSKQFDTVGLD